MTDAEKQEPHSEEDVNEAPSMPEQNGAPDLGQHIQKLEADLAEANDRMLRALADAENTKRRITKEKDDAVKYAAANFARNLLNVTDNFRRAIESVENGTTDIGQNENVQNLIEGIKAIEREMLQAFELAGIKKIESQGQAFDPNMHEVMFEVETNETPEGHIVQIIQDGYVMHDRLLRPARVGVAKSNKQGGDDAPQSVDTIA